MCLDGIELEADDCLLYSERHVSLLSEDQILGYFNRSAGNVSQNPNVVVRFLYDPTYSVREATMAKERGKIRGFFFEIDGGDETLQEGLRNFGMALGRALSGPPRPVKALPPASGKGKHHEKEDEVEGEVVETEPDLFDIANENGEENGAAKKKKPGTPRKPAQMPKVIELDLEGKKGVSFKEFAIKKKPENFSERFLVATAWLKDYGGVNEVTANHMFTCYKIAGWTPHPNSYYTTLNDLRHKQKSLDKGSAAGTYRINLHGENLVSQMTSKE